MALPKINKVKDVIGKPFRIISCDKPSVLSDYAYYQKNNKTVFAKYTDDTKTRLERYDKTSKKWVADDFKNYWYKEKNPTTGKEQNKNYLSEHQNYTIEFKDTASLNCYNSEAKKVEAVIGKKFFFQIRGTDKFGTAKKLIDTMSSAEAMDNKFTDVWYKMEQDGIGYKFSLAGKVPEELLVATKEEVDKKESIIEEAVREFQKDESKSRQDILKALINTYGLDPFDARQVIEKNFKDRL